MTKIGCVNHDCAECQKSKREWVGLTDEERENLGLAYMQTGQTAHSFVLSIEAGLKVKNT